MEDKALTIFATVLITIGVTFLCLALVVEAATFHCTNPNCNNRVQYSDNYCSHCGKLYRIADSQ